MASYSQPAVITSTAQVGANAIETADIKDGNVTPAKLQNGTWADILIAGVGGVFKRLGIGTSGYALLSAGAGADPVWGAIPAAPTTQTFGTPGSPTWTKPANLRYITVVCIGGGGGGGGGYTGAGFQNGGSGGGGGASNSTLISAINLPATVAVTVGAAGTGGAIDTNGVDGGSSSFGSYLSANGGTKGLARSTSGGAGGTATGSGVAGSAGTGGTGAGKGGAGGAAGGYSATAGAGGAATTGNAGAGENGHAGSDFGGGGGGGVSASESAGGGAGANGGKGEVIVYEFY